MLINGNEVLIQPRVLINGAAADRNAKGEPIDLNLIELNDNDVIDTRAPRTVGEALRNAGYPPTGRRINYKLNGRDAHYSSSPKILLNDASAHISLPIQAGDSIEYDAQDAPKIADIVNAQELSVKFFYKGEEYSIPATDIQIKLNGREATLNAIVDDGAEIQYKAVQRKVMVSDALLAINFKAPDARSRIKFEIRVNGAPAEFIHPITSGDTLEVILETPDEEKLGASNEITLPASGLVPVTEKTPARFKNITIADLIRKD